MIPTGHRSFSARRRIKARIATAAAAKRTRNASCRPDSLPIEQDERQHGPDGDIVKARIAQQPLAERFAQDLEFTHDEQQHRQCGHGAGHADAQYGLPWSAFSARPAGKAQQDERRPAAEDHGYDEREGSGRAGLTTIEPGRAQVELDPGTPVDEDA